MDESACSPSVAVPAAAAGQPFPCGLTLLERATAALRAHLDAHGLPDYAVFYAGDLDVADLDRFLPRLDPRAAWRPIALLDGGAQPLALAEDDGRPARLEPGGVLHLPRHRFVLARWYSINDRGQYLQSLRLAAAPADTAAAGADALCRALVDLRRRGDAPVWQVVRDAYDSEIKPRQPLAWDDLFLPADVVARVRAEVVQFFAPAVAELYRSLDVPYRRGVLMHGPPGNGKTSIVRALGAALPDVPAILLRPARSFDDGDLQYVFRKWADHAPALLVIEDLDHVLKTVDFSQFLNLIDGIEGSLSGGLMLVATTNHPEQLDPALNNRPGRFDVVMEVPCPDAGLRRSFFDRHLPAEDAAVRARLAADTDGLSFSHLQEIVRLAGLIAIHDAGGVRTAEHLRRATDLVRAGHRNALHGFPPAPDAAFGLAQFRRRE
jgi:hypothetical protein